ncbi:MAG: Glycosyl transferase family 2 [Candidatus Moranbacteria bacterium GW2011_GWE2_35_2-]|nr:MAG: Glycosyl transferase family 2 [Candidatus Moranbacteria bacterium GW2011_GWE2_35_2-]KKQ22856.1 MAG: Glycosyl transferase family 2 [Candidatus Moranbacteria bacterium GW2011_GWF2_37_11]KKQ28632.1 MAG: Glycosyl transferase family 2 [Candidatus Moranbacteria bacterium GW2011_GWD1_37_17]KKQ30913.1 MAG: Glycosyl transferase family 2 [Candidatus Moranbacteria bacterium GW2011_GWE1_37_24]KKQ47225.1 MAG: Glycosyl transferase family 2 [Candidatus Moranbacteria bacterium GW2011_GWD2_37_9]HBO1689
MKNNKKIYIVIPAYNEEKVIADVAKEIRDAGYEKIIIVDDGSSDGTFSAAKKIPGAIALRHKINRGKGAAAKTGIEAAKILGADIIVTMDADGQHDPKDIARLISPIIKGNCDVVLGSRLMNPEGMPWYKIIHNKIGNAITWYLYGLWVTDSQSGLRAYSRRAAEVINTLGDRYEYDSEVIREIYKYKLRYKEIPIQVRYTEYSMGKAQKQSLAGGIKTVWKMLWKLVH